MNVWRKVQQLHEAMRHIFDNDTSGFPGQFEMTVRYRCGQCNELSPVWIFWKICLSIRGYLEADVFLLADNAKAQRKEQNYE